MAIKRVQDAAYLRGMCFEGKRNIRYMYCILTPDGFFRADTLEAIYRKIMSYPRLR